MTKTEFPFKVGEVVGWRGMRCRIVMRPTPGSTRVAIRTPNNPFIRVRITELHDPPPLAPHVQEAADQFAAFLSDPESIFGGEV